MDFICFQFIRTEAEGGCNKRYKMKKKGYSVSAPPLTKFLKDFDKKKGGE